jgi:hypothetical protein
MLARTVKFASLLALAALAAAQLPKLPKPGSIAWRGGRGGGGTSGVWSVVSTSASVDLTSSGSAYTITMPAAGDVLVLSMNLRTSASDTITGVTGACSVPWAQGARSVNAPNLNRAQEIWYCTAAAASTSVVVNYTAAGSTVTVWMWEARTTGSGAVIDAGGGTISGSCTTPTCTGPSLLATGNDLFYSYFTSGTASPTAIAAPWIFGTADLHGNPFGYSLNRPAGSLAPVWTEGTDNSVNNNVVAFRDTLPAGGTVHYLINLGNSNITNYFQLPAISTTQPCNNTMLYSLSLTPLLASVGGGGEGPQPGMGNQLSVLAAGGVGTCSSYRVNPDVQVAIGAAYNPGLMPGSATYNAAVADISTVKTAVNNRGLAMTVDASVYGAGGTDFQNQIPASTYTGDMASLQSSFQAAAFAVTGQSGILPMLMYMNSKWTETPPGSATPTYPGGAPGIQFGVWNAFLANQSRFVLPGPSYQYTYQPSGTAVDHTDAPSNLTMGQKVGEVLKRITVDQQSWVPLMYRNVSISGTTVTFEMWVPYPPIVIDVTSVPNWSNTVSGTCRFYGFEFFDNSGTPPCITAAVVSAPDTLTLTLASAPTGAPSSFRLRYDYTGTVGAIQGTSTAPGGNIRDSDPTVPEQSGGYPLYNWLMGPMDIAIPSSFAPAVRYFISPTGSDSNNGTSAAAPWLSPNHPVHCGDTITAAAGTYSSANFANGKWGAVTNCLNPAPEFASLICGGPSVTSCVINDTAGSAMRVDASHWWIQGWQASSTVGACFYATPSSAANISYIAFVNNIALGCFNNGISSSPYFANSAFGVDYFAAVGNIAYNAAQGGTECYSGFSAYEPKAVDTNAGTHYFFDQDFAIGNIDPVTGCPGNSDGEGFILDDWASQQTTGIAYTSQGVIENSLAVGNGSAGVELFSNTGAPMTVKNVTSWGNYRSTVHAGTYNGEGLLSSAQQTTWSNNIFQAALQTQNGNNVYGFLVGTGVFPANNTNTVSGNYIFGVAGNNTSNQGTGFVFGTNTLASPGFAAPAIPGAPNCGGYATVTACMIGTGVVANFTPSGGAATYGYQVPSSTQIADPLWPTWLCGMTFPPGLVTNGCGP